MTTAQKRKKTNGTSPAANGFYRVHLAGGADWLTAYVPLDEGYELDPKGPRPWLLKGCFGEDEYLGELQTEPSAMNRISWATVSDSRTDLGTAPIRLGTRVLVVDENGDTWTLTVRSLARV